MSAKLITTSNDFPKAYFAKFTMSEITAILAELQKHEKESVMGPDELQSKIRETKINLISAANELAKTVLP